MWMSVLVQLFKLQHISDLPPDVTLYQCVSEDGELQAVRACLKLGTVGGGYIVAVAQWLQRHHGCSPSHVSLGSLAADTIQVA